MRQGVAEPPTAAVHVAGADTVPDSLNPKVTEPPAGIWAFHAALVMVSEPFWALPTASHGDTLVPCHGRVIDQPFTAVAPVFRTTTATVRPLPQSDVTLTLTASPVPDFPGKWRFGHDYLLALYLSKDRSPKRVKLGEQVTHRDRRVAILANTDRTDGRARDFLKELHVRPGICWQVIQRLGAGDVL